MSALKRARDHWGAAEVVDARSPEMLVDLLRAFGELHADAAAGRLDGLAATVLDGELAEPSPGWWVCPECGRQSDREGARGTARRWCLGSLRGYASHPPVEMEIRR